MNIYQAVVDEWQKDCVLEQDKLIEAGLKTPSLHGKYIKEYGKASSLYESLKHDLDVLKNHKFQYYNLMMSKKQMDELGWKYDPWDGHIKPPKTDIDKWVSADLEIKELSLKTEEAKTYKEIVKYILNDIQYRGNLISTIFENIKRATGF